MAVEFPDAAVNIEGGVFIAKELDKCNLRLRIGESVLRSRKDIEQFWAGKLAAMVDGVDLGEASGVPQAHRCIREPSRLLTGRDFIMYIRARFNLPHHGRS